MLSSLCLLLTPSSKLAVRRLMPRGVPSTRRRNVFAHQRRHSATIGSQRDASSTTIHHRTFANMFAHQTMMTERDDIAMQHVHTAAAAASSRPNARQTDRIVVQTQPVRLAVGRAAGGSARRASATAPEWLQTLAITAQFRYLSGLCKSERGFVNIRAPPQHVPRV